MYSRALNKSEEHSTNWLSFTKDTGVNYTVYRTKEYRTPKKQTTGNVSGKFVS